MIHEVEIGGTSRGKDTKFGVVKYDDETGEFSTEPANDQTLRSILDTPIRLAGNKTVDRRTPVPFMEGLHKHYKSYALHAGECVSYDPGLTGNASYSTYDIPYAEDVR